MKARNKGRGLKRNKSRINWWAIASVLVILVFVFVYVLSNKPMWGEKPQVKQSNPEIGNQHFKIEGKLQFLDENNNPVADFYVEIADDEYSREKGMMYKHYIPDTVGMLFIFPREDQRFFWMKNTPSSLDIIYGGENLEIVSIHENTPPYSQKSIPSGDKAKYVIELKAGSVARFGISGSHSFSYQLTGQPTD